MYYISYRGLVNGQNEQTENTPDQIGKALGMGFGVMIDVWRENNKLYLGSNVPTIEVSATYIQGRRFWINARNSDMYNWLQSQSSSLYPNYFQVILPLQPSYTTSSGYLWTYGETPASPTLSIMVIPESYDSACFSCVNLRAYGICSTLCPYIKRIRNEGLSVYGAFY
jgi:hypothetical protein